MAMKWAVRWSMLARADIRAIAQFIAQENPARARSFAAELRGQVEALEEFPKRGRVGRIDSTRELVAHENYIAIYRVLDGERVVQVLRVKHTAQQTP